MTAAINLLLVIVKSMLFDPMLLGKVNLPLSSFIMCSCLLASYSSIFQQLELALTSCQVFDLALQSTAIKMVPPLTTLISPKIL